MSKREDFHAPRADHPTGPGTALSEDKMDAATRMLTQVAIRNGVTGPGFMEALRMLGLLETSAGDARPRPLGGTRKAP